ncbi:MFS transporter [Thermodesulfobacteriota bacterium]
MYSSGSVFSGFTAAFEPIAQEFGWSYTQISLASSIRGFEVSLLVPITGLIIDHWGPRVSVFGGAILSGLGSLIDGGIISRHGFSSLALSS